MKSIKVLIVEDELLISETIKLFLEERGHSVVGMAISFEKAVKYINEGNPDLVLLDIRLYGEKSGIDVAEYIRTEVPHIPYVILSSQYDPNIIEKAMHAGASGYLTKPISKETLWSTIELAAMKAVGGEDEYIDLNISYGTQRVKKSDIIYIKSDHVYIEVVCENAKYISRSTLSEISKKIDSSNFIQCHRSYIINIDKMRKFNSSKVWIADNEIPISTKYKERVRELLEK